LRSAGTRSKVEAANTVLLSLTEIDEGVAEGDAGEDAADRDRDDGEVRQHNSSTLSTSLRA
jgi:hypothetical protein